MIKVMYAPLNYSDVVQYGTYDAFRESGCELEIFDYIYEKEKLGLMECRKKLIERCVAFEPHLLYLQIQHTDIIDGTTVKRIKERLPKTKIVNYTIDVRNYIPPTYKDVGLQSDFNLISSTGQLDMFRSHFGNNVKYLQIGYNPQMYYPTDRPNKFDYDVSFIANVNNLESYPGHAERAEACRLLRKRFGSRFGLFGHGWPSDMGSLGSIAQPTVSQIYQKSACVLSLSHYNDLSHYFSDRLLMCLASGRPTVTYRFPNWESYFTDNSDIVVADNIHDIPTKVTYLVENPDLADFIGESGAAKVFAEHTYFSRINELLEMIGLR